jgi:lysozyme family protein
MTNPDTGYHSIFNNNNNDDAGKNPDDLIETKMTSRADALKTATTFEDFKEDTVEREARLRKDDREKRFKERRLQQQIKVEVGQSLQDHMSIAKDIWDECNKMKVQVKNF